MVIGFVLVVWAALIMPAMAQSDARVTLQFNKARVAEVLKLHGMLTGREFFLSADLDDLRVSINSPGELSPEDAAALIESRLSGNYSIVFSDIGENRILVTSDRKKSAAARPRPEAGADAMGAEAPATMPPPAPAPEHLYRATEGLAGEDLKRRLREITGNHTVFKYSATLALVKHVHEDPASPDNVILVYSRRPAPKDDYHRAGAETIWDREHVLPKSYGAQKGRISTSDLHNLFPSIIPNNAARANLYFDESDAGAEVPPLAPGCSYDLDSWEPPDEVKGDLARVIFYMDTRYDGSDTRTDIAVGEVADPAKGTFGKLSTLLAWHRADPVSDDERRRNDRIFALQGNRNPFVDRPEFAEAVYQSAPE